MDTPIGADFALIYGSKVDKYGNVAYYGTTRNSNVVMATAAKTVIIEAEEFVDCLDPNDVIIPGKFVPGMGGSMDLIVGSKKILI